MSGTITITFEGEPVEAREGESLAAALTAHGIDAFRTTRCEAERGLFCGMGVCQDCLVEVDGKPNQRACMTRVDRPLSVRREAHARPLAPAMQGQPPATIGDVEVQMPEILVIGAGPGGLSAAIAARRAGAQVLVVDERSQPGGQYFKQLSVGAEAGPPPDRQHREGAALIEEARSLGVELRSGVTVWGAFEPNEFAATAAGRPLRLLPKAAIVATGAYERGWPVPGWTLPGVMTTGAAQTLWRTARRLPGRRVLIAGNGPLNLQLAAELIEGGAEVPAVVEAAPRPGLARLGALLAMARSSPRLIRDGLRYHAARRSGGAAMVHGMVVAGIEKTPAGLQVRLAPAAGTGAERRYEVDAVCLGYGFEPSNELLRALGCGHDFDPVRRQLVTRRDARGLTDMAGVYALGDCTGLGGARAALAEGTIVGLAAAAALGHAAPAGSRAASRRAGRDLARHRDFQKALWSLYAAPAYSSKLATADTLICRCEEVSFGQIEEALGEEMELIGAVKRRTRVGMGRCQGRYCAPVLDALLAERFGRPRDEFSGFAPRIPVKPVAIGDLAGPGAG
ncbi:2Fe-2S iron-sulfur cluster-binding protein [Labrys monachus]|uniref:NADPH-dependent 2,4-dienoyl-CoA reductase/sulfur reductase-like enzyme/ferredoxin n=1 Tax=Labrys monachus TaxID=217067 RepID=A0ABU0F7I6_9HYPH|nr:2Fe-2S iron-sulfur cluster-binding protein [Labrys monachus]MDQ0390516.1 NADPH-dependent 2,4-dienoyl-CoA reductase/sulfur reductase-like enzyme/ferredoxin [Labrys monachus]